ncbi:MAG TPA: helix-turn-helix domain-containing protein [Falsiroseomonas sp.]|nr:helix-turn-helix domain-containing protein [Falsiroseomonas sp.]
MPDKALLLAPLDSAIALLRQLREPIGGRHSGIAFDVGLLLYEQAEVGMAVGQITQRTGYSGPTIRMVLERLMNAGSVCVGRRVGRTRFYCLTPHGLAGYDAYVAATLGFAERAAAMLGTLRGFSAAGVPVPGPDQPEGRQPPPARHADGRSAPQERA